jgi:integrase
LTIELPPDSIFDLVAPQKSPIANLPASISCFKIKNTSGAIFWRVRVGKKFTGGSVILKNFASLGDAKEWILGETQKLRAKPGSLIELKALAGNAAFRLSPAQITEAADAFRRLSETSLTLTEAVSYAIQHACPTAGTLSVADAIKAAQKAKSGRRPSYRADIFRRWRRLERWLPPNNRKAINTITQTMVRKFLSDCDLNPEGERNMLRNISVLFSWAVDHQYLKENPCSGIKVEAQKSDEPVRILSIKEAEHLLKSALTTLSLPLKTGKERIEKITVQPGDLIPWITVGMFAGVRPEEAKLLEWHHIDFGRRHIDLPAKIAKDHQRRIIPMEPNLIEWLKPYRPATGEGKIVRNYRWKFQAFVKSINFSPWPKDCLRHSYGSYHLAKYENSGKTAAYMGHRSSQMLYERYREVIKEQADIEAFWKIVPP